MDNKRLPIVAQGPDVQFNFTQGPNVKLARTVLPVDRDLSDTDSIVYELLVNKAWDQHDAYIQMAEEHGYELMDDDIEQDGITYDYYFKFMDNKVTLDAEELRVILSAASMWFATAKDPKDPKDPEMVEMVKRGQTILHKLTGIADEQVDTFDIIAR